VRLAARHGDGQIGDVSHPFLPYALSTPSFPFRHLAALAGRAPIGGAREVALACYMTARLAAERRPSSPELPEDARQVRAAAARSWLGTLTLPAAVRTPLARCMESSAAGTATVLARDVAAVRAACASYLDATSRAELDALAGELTGDGQVALPAPASET
jgi:hypothetical protein